MFDLLSSSHLKDNTFSRVEKLIKTPGESVTGRVDHTIEATIFYAMLRNADEFSNRR